MEPKKNPKYDVHRMRGLILNISLIISLGLVIAAFQWSEPLDLDVRTMIPGKKVLEETILVPVTGATPPAPPAAPRTVQASAPAVTPVLTTLLKEVIDEPDEDLNLQLDQGTEWQLPPVVDIPEDSVGMIFDTFDRVEKMPEPRGGYGEFYKTLGKNLKYPSRAYRMGTQGRVFVQFVVTEKGEVADVKVVRGIGNGCDEEAMRVIALTQWHAGKQRGRPVKVRMVQPVYFALP